MLSRYSHLACASALLLLVASTATAQTVKVQVEVSGVEGELRSNILYYLSLNDLSNSETEVSVIERLHRQAPAEIRTALQPFGYYRPEIDPQLSSGDSIWVAAYNIEPGPPIEIRRVAVEVIGAGRNEQRFQDLVSTFPLQAGDVLQHAAYEDGKAEFKAAAAELGYLDATFDNSRIEIDLDPYQADVVLKFDTGPRFKFGNVTFTGSELDTAVLQTYVPFRRGDPFTVERLIQLQTNLTESPYFTRAEVYPAREASTGLEVPIRVDLERQKARRFEFGVGYGTDTGFRGRFETALRRINRRGHRAIGEVRASRIERSLSARYIIPRAFPSTGVITFFAGYADLEPSTSRSDRILVGSSLASDWGRWRQTLSLSFEHESFEVAADTGTSNLLLAKGDWSRTRANDPIFPTRGHRAQIEIKGAHDAVLSSATFLQLTAGGKLIRGLGGRARFITRADVGATLTSDFRSLPPSIRFFAGGDRSVRGYGFRSLGPLDENGNVIGGEVLITGSIELDYRLLNRWGVAAFFDVGDALDSIRLSLEQGAGVGIRWRSPVGLARVDGAFALTREGTPFRLHLMIGPDL